jgi:hypothetical protein
LNFLATRVKLARTPAALTGREHEMITFRALPLSALDHRAIKRQVVLANNRTWIKSFALDFLATRFELAGGTAFSWLSDGMVTFRALMCSTARVSTLVNNNWLVSGDLLTRGAALVRFLDYLIACLALRFHTRYTGATVVVSSWAPPQTTRAALGRGSKFNLPRLAPELRAVILLTGSRCTLAVIVDTNRTTTPGRGNRFEILITVLFVTI